MTTAERRAAREGKLLRALAAVLLVEPGIPFRSLAERAGVSRRTLYRLASSREMLIRRLRQEAAAATSESIVRARIDDSPFLETLLALTSDFLLDSELYSFWSPASWAEAPTLALQSDADEATHEYRQRMIGLFLRGQREGILRADVSAGWMILTYDALLLAAASSLRSGTLPLSHLTGLVLDSLLRGLAVDRAAAAISSLRQSMADGDHIATTCGAVDDQPFAGINGDDPCTPPST